tara:strand:- start:3300 stop:3482 length:183 start_codon:yes stop_codon:yes gene_type:complete
LQHIRRKVGRVFYFAFFYLKLDKLSVKYPIFLKEINLSAAFIPIWDKENASWVHKKVRDL